MTLNIGCGKNNREEGDIGLDVDIASLPTVCGNCERLPFKDKTFDKIIASHILEHVNDIVSVMDECWRVLKDDGKFLIAVPRFPHEFAVADPTHRRFFVPFTFTYFTVEGRLSGLKHLWERITLKQNDWEIACVLAKA